MCVCMCACMCVVCVCVCVCVHGDGITAAYKVIYPIFVHTFVCNFTNFVPKCFVPFLPANVDLTCLREHINDKDGHRAWLVCFDPVANRWNSAGVTGVRGKYKASKDMSCGCKRRHGDGQHWLRVSPSQQDPQIFTVSDHTHSPFSLPCKTNNQ